MQIANLQNVTTYYGAQAVLRGVSFNINPGEKLGLIGANGSGKTTVLRVLLGQETPVGGSATLSSGIRTGYVPQHVVADDDDTVLDWLLSEHHVLVDALRLQEERLAHSTGLGIEAALRAIPEGPRRLRPC